MAYNSSTGKITAPVGIYDIQRALGVSSSDLGTLCKHPNINMWAKYKPVQLYQVKNTVTGQWDFTNNKWLSSATWWKGLSTAFAGITPPTITTFAQLIAAYTGGANGWVYNPPAGNIHPFRQQDFACYNHQAKRPMENFYISSQVIEDGDFSGSALMNMPAADADYITLDDFVNVNVRALYFGIMFVKPQDGTQTNVVKARVTSDVAAVSQVDSSFANSGNQLPLGSYKVYPFFSNKVMNISDTYEPTSLRLYSCPYCDPIDVEIVSRNQSIDATVDAKYHINSNTVLDIEIKGDTTRTLQNCSWYILPMTYWNNPDSGLTHYVQKESIGTINADTTYNKLNVTVTAGNYFVYVLFELGTYTRKTNILETLPPSQ